MSYGNIDEAVHLDDKYKAGANHDLYNGFYDFSDEDNPKKNPENSPENKLEIIVHKEIGSLRTRKATLSRSFTLKNKIICLKYSPDSRYLACGTSTGTIIVYDNCLAGPQLFQEFQLGYACSITSLRWIIMKSGEPSIFFVASNGNAGIRSLNLSIVTEWVKQDKNNEYLALDISPTGFEAAIADKSGKVSSIHF